MAKYLMIINVLGKNNLLGLGTPIIFNLETGLSSTYNLSINYVV